VSDQGRTTCKRCDQEFQVEWTTGLATPRGFIPRHKALCGRWCMSKTEANRWGLRVHFSIASCDICEAMTDDKRTQKEKLAAFGIDLDATSKPVNKIVVQPGPPPAIKLEPSAAALANAKERQQQRDAGEGVGDVRDGGLGTVDRGGGDIQERTPDVRVMRNADDRHKSGEHNQMNNAKRKPEPEILDYGIADDYINAIQVATPLLKQDPIEVPGETRQKAIRLTNLALDRLIELLK